MDIFKRVVKILSGSRGYNEEKINIETQLSDDLQLDSLDMYELVIQIEDEFGIAIQEVDLDEIETVGDVVNLIKNVYVTA